MPDNKLKQFHDSIKGNPNISGVPDDFNTFQSALKNPSTSKVFFDAISKNNAISGIPKDYNTFASSLGIVEKKSPKSPTASSGMGVSTAGKDKLPVGVASQKTLQSYGVTPVGGKTTSKEIYKGVVSEAKRQSKLKPKPADDRNIVEKVVDPVIETLTSGVTQIASGAAGLIGGTASLMTNKAPDTKKYPFMSNEWIKQKFTQQGEVKDPSWFSNQGIRDNFMKLSKNLSEISSTESSIAKGNLGVQSTQKSSIDHILEGNYKDAAKSALVDIGTQIPMLATMVYTGGSTASFGAMGATSMGSELNRQYEQDGDINSTDYVQGMTNGITEVVAERFFDMNLKAGDQIVAKLSDMLGDAGNELRKKVQSEGVDKVAGEIVRNFSDVFKQGAKGAGQEWAEENIVSMVNYLTRALDEDVFNKEEFGKFVKELGNNAIVAGPLGGGMSTLAAAASMAPLTSEEKVKIEKYTEIINDQNSSNEVKKIAKQKLQEVQDGRESSSEEMFNGIVNLPIPERVEAISKINKISKLEEEARSSKDVDIKDSIEARISELKSEIGSTIASGNELRAEQQSAETNTDEVVENTNISKPNQDAIKESLSTVTNTESALNSASEFQVGNISELQKPVVGGVASVFSKDGKLEKANVTVEDIDTENRIVTIVDSAGKKSKVPLNKVKKPISQIAEEYHQEVQSGERTDLSSSVENIITNDVSGEGVNKQRRISAKVETQNPLRTVINSSPGWIKNIYDKVFSSGDRSAVRALETKGSLMAEKQDRLSEVSKKLSRLVGKDTGARSDANTALSKDYIDDKIDSLTNKTTIGAMAALTGIDETVIQNAYDNPDAPESINVIQEVDNNLRSQTEKGTKAQVDELILGEITKDKEVVRDLSVKWINSKNKKYYDSQGKEITRNNIEEDISKLYGGEKILETLKSSEAETQKATERLLETKQGREILAAVNESREMIDEFANWVEDNIAALNIKDKDIGRSIIENSGLYMKKTYEYWADSDFTFDEKLGKQAVSSIAKSMLPNKLSRLATSQKFIDADDAQRKYMIESLIKDNENKASVIFAKYISEITAKKEFKPSNIYPNEAKVNSKNTWQREFINEEFGKILGKSEDAVDRLHASVVAQSQIQAAAEMGMILEKLSGEAFFNSKEEGLKSLMDSGMSEVEAGVEFGKKYKEVKDKYSPLDGKWMPTEVYDEVYESIQDHSNQLFNALKFATVLWRMTKTVFNPAGHITNAMGGNIAIMEQGHFIDNKTVDFFLDRFRLMKGSGNLSDYAKEIKKKMIDTGVWGTSVSIGDINLILKYSNDLNSGDKNISEQALIQLKKTFNQRLGGIKRYYSATDDLSKLILFHKKKDVFAKKLYGKPYESLTSKEEAIVDANIGERIKQNMPTSSRLPKFAKAIIGSVVIGDFQGFRFGAFTSFLNTISNAVSDIRKGYSDKSLSKTQADAYKLDGFKTLSSSAAIFTMDKYMAAAMVGMAASAMGSIGGTVKNLFKEEEDDEGKKIGSKFDFYQNIKNSFFIPEWGVGQNFAVASDDGKGHLKLLNFSNTFPNDEAYKILGAQKNLPMINMDGNSSIGSAITETFGTNAVLGIFKNAIEGRDNWNKPIDNTFLGRLSYAASEYSIPSIKNLNKQAIKYAKDKEGVAPEAYDDIDTRRVTLLNYMKGILSNSPQLIKRTYDLDLNKQVYYNMTAFYKDNDKKFENLNTDEKYERIKKLEPVRQAYLELKKYEKFTNGGINADQLFDNAFKGQRGKVSDEEKNYIKLGEKP